MVHAQRRQVIPAADDEEAVNGEVPELQLVARNSEHRLVERTAAVQRMEPVREHDRRGQHETREVVVVLALGTVVAESARRTHP